MLAIGLRIARQQVGKRGIAFGHQLVGDAGDVAAGHHHAARQLVHLQAFGLALELRHQVKARQGGVKLLTQLGAHLLFDQLREREHSQPEPQFFRVFTVAACFQVHFSFSLVCSNCYVYSSKLLPYSLD